MSRIAVVAEGFGDVPAIPVLIARTSNSIGLQVFVSNVVRAGGWLRLKQAGQLERFCTLAASHQGVTKVLIVVDLDDGCAKMENERVADRIKEISLMIGVPVHLCFCVREFETWFIENIQSVKSASPEVDWKEIKPRVPSEIRGAKEAFEKMLGSRYRETIDQERFSRRIDPIELMRTSRSFRKFVKSFSDLDYGSISEIAGRK